MSGIVAAGLALTNGTVRVLDGAGNAVTVSNKNVAASTGAYGPITLGSAIPYRIEACGTVGDKPVCLFGATNVGGTVNLTPLTSAIAVLASGQPPEALMKEKVKALRLTDADITAAQMQVRNAVAPALADAGLASDFDLLAGALTPGSHTAQDRLLDTVSVAFGTDTKAYVALSSRFGTGVAYLEPAVAQQGGLSLHAAAATLDLLALNALFTAMNAAMVPASKGNDGCAANLTPLLDANVRATAYTSTPPSGGETANGEGAGLSSQLLCLMLGGTLGDWGSIFGGKLLPPVIAGCDFGATAPVCRVSFVYMTTKGLLRPLGIEQAAIQHADGWKFLGNRLEVQAKASARLVLARRLDAASTTPAPDTYTRQLDIAIPVVGGLQCARASQKDASGADVPLAIFKRHFEGRYLSLWSLGSANPAPSLSAGSGALRAADVTAVPVPNGAAGNATARNFARAGLTLKIELFSDMGCTTPLAGADGDSLLVDVAGHLPVSAAGMSGQPWPTLTPAAATSLIDLKGSVNATVKFGPTWTFPRNDVAVERARLCTLDPDCTIKLVELDLASNATGAALTANVGNLALAAKDYKLLRITARTSDGLVLQLDAASCPAQIAGQPC